MGVSGGSGAAHGEAADALRLASSPIALAGAEPVPSDPVGAPRQCKFPSEQCPAGRPLPHSRGPHIELVRPAVRPTGSRSCTAHRDGRHRRRSSQSRVQAASTGPVARAAGRARTVPMRWRRERRPAGSRRSAVVVGERRSSERDTGTPTSERSLPGAASNRAGTETQLVAVPLRLDATGSATGRETLPASTRPRTL